jgi:spermidine synthase
LVIAWWVGGLVTGVSGALYHLCFDSPRLFWLVALGTPALAMGPLAAGSVLYGRVLLPALAKSGFFVRWARPFPLLGIAVVFGLGLALAARAGMVKSSLALGLVWIALAWWWATEEPRWTVFAWISAASLVTGAVLLSQSHRLVPPVELARHPAEVLCVHTSPRGHEVVTSTQGHHGLFVNGRLEVSTLDEHRYYEALVHPALQSASRRERILLLGGGTGPAEREILRYPEVREVVIVRANRGVFDLARGMRWLSRRSEEALRDPRLRLVEAEPIVWLGQAQDQFDAAIVDLPEPVSYFEGKDFTRFFYRQLRRRVTSEGVAAVQATSPLVSPRTFALIQATLKAAGWLTLAYHAPILSLGDWGFVLASQRPLSPPTTVPRGTLFLTPGVLAGLFRWPGDIPNPEPGSPNLLFDQRLVEEFEEERP